MSSSVVLRMADFNIYQVSNGTFRQLNSDRVQLNASNASIFIVCVCVRCRCQQQTSAAPVQKL